MMNDERVRSLVFSQRSLRRFLEACTVSGGELDWDVPEDGSWGVVRTEIDGHIYILDERGADVRGRIVIPLIEDGGINRLQRAGLETALRRLHRVAVKSLEGGVSVPRAWNPYQADNRVQLFAYQESIGSERLIVEVSVSGSDDVLLAGVSSEEAQVDLSEFEPDHAVYQRAIEGFGRAASQVEVRFEEIEYEETPGRFDLEAASYGSIVEGRTYSAWLPELSERQRKFVEHPPSRSLKLRGPAGSGKTLAMELKVLHELYRDESERRILYVTHSWSVAEQVQEALDRLDERNVLSQVDVFPLLTLAEDSLDLRGELTVLGEDSVSGKRAQLEVLKELVLALREGNWIAFKSSCRDEFIERVEANRNSPEFAGFLWDLMLEFTCVIGAKGIMPGVNAIERYKDIERRPWMMPLRQEAELAFVFEIYERFVQDLLDEGRITTDQVINDYLNLLSTYRWHSRRRSVGYDMIFVDELHLFNEQERMVFHLLTRDPDDAPRLFMALDPKQSPAETYTDVLPSELTTGESGGAEATYGEYESIDLVDVYRYTPEIYEFLVHLDRNYPALELGEDWDVSVATAETTRSNGEVPRLFVHSAIEEEADRVLERASHWSDNGRVAILCLEEDIFDYIVDQVAGRGGYSIIQSRDDVEELQYTIRSIVVSQPHYVAGLQFDVVLIAGCRPQFTKYAANQSYGLRRLLSDMYLGASRARDVLEIHGSGGAGEYPQFIDEAVQEGIVEGPL